MALEKIQKANDIKELTEEELKELSDEIRQFLIEKISVTGGHLASNLGVVELTMALHKVLHFPEDKLIWDVGHQSYTHKLLTGRKEGFDDLRKYGGMSGFPKRKESKCDAFDTGHSSTSISAGLGYVAARELQQEHYNVVSVIGDGSMTGGMAYEALNNASRLKSNFIIVLNDNNMSISKNVGGMSNYLNGLRTTQVYSDLKRGVEDTIKRIPGRGERIVHQVKKTKSGIKQLFVPGMFFENMGITYLGPVDGTNIKEIRKVLAEAKRVRGPVLVHVRTIKGEGYLPAERHPARFHGTGPFDIDTGVPLYHQEKAHYTDVFSTVMRKMGEREPKVVAITAAMADGTGLKRFKNLFPERFFDVGIAEETAVALASGIAANGGKPIWGVYSSFVQRTYDQISQDLCINGNAATMVVYWGTVYGMNDVTHLGLYDIAMLSNIPNLVYLAPTTKEEYLAMLDWSMEQNEHPVAIRTPGSTMISDGKEVTKDFSKINTYEMTQKGSKTALIGLGTFYSLAKEVAAEIEAKTGTKATVINPYYITGIDQAMLEDLKKDHDVVVTLEDGILDGGFGEKIARFYGNSNVKVLNFGLKKEFLDRYDVEDVLKANHLTKDQIVADIISTL